MQAKDLKNLIGQEVATGSGWGQPTLASADHRYRLIDGPFAIEYWIKREDGTHSHVPQYISGRGKLWLAENLDDPDREERYLESKTIMGTWADHLAAKAEEDERRAKDQQQREAAEAEADRKTDRINAAMVTAGIGWRASLRSHSENVRVPLTVLFDLIERAGLEPEAVPDA